ncbi:MAG: hypothetical protein NTX87_20025 [Planctomycetota bacterium]|nr:hypothetical protein [Planctomycetota bacterium]
MTPVALVGPPSGGVFPVQFLVRGERAADAKMTGEARRELDFYLVEKAEPDPWAYALHHCNTAANLYSCVHWCMSAGVLPNWKGDDIQVARSKGGVLTTAHPFDNLIRPAGAGWPPAEVVQKLYKSRQERCFDGLDACAATSGLGFYCDLQSLHSEDAITWSVFGTLTGLEKEQTEKWVADLLALLDLDKISPRDAHIYLWRRTPHPDTIVPGGPEIDFGIMTDNGVLLGEAKWLSGIGQQQGKDKDKDQVQLRGEFLKEFGCSVYAPREHFAVVVVGLAVDSIAPTVPHGIAFRIATWQAVCSLPSHPHLKEVQQYYIWKEQHTRRTKKSARATPAPPG